MQLCSLVYPTQCKHLTWTCDLCSDLISSNLHYACYVFVDFVVCFSVRQSYPDEAGYVNQKEKDIMDMWDALKVLTLRLLV